MASKRPPLAVGDIVKYRAAFLRSIGEYSGPLPFARGEIIAITPLGDLAIAEINWHSDDIPPRVNVANLCQAADSELP